MTSGCLGALPDATDGHEATSSDPIDPTANDANQGPTAPNDLETRPATVEIQLSLEDTSRIPLTVESMTFDPPISEEFEVHETRDRIVPGETSPLAKIELETGDELPRSTLEIRFFDGLGAANLTLHLDSHVVEDDVIETVRLTDQGPGRIEAIGSTGPLSATARPSHAVPQYGALVWPDEDRRPLPGFDHAIQVPAQFPAIPAGEPAQFMVEAPDEQEVVWRVNDEKRVRGNEFAFTPDPGRHNVRVSVGPGQSSTSFTVHTDHLRTVNDTIVAGAPVVNETAEPANAHTYELPVKEDAIWVKVVLRPEEPNELEDLDVYLVDPEGDVVDFSTREDTSGEVLTYDGRISPGAYTVEVKAEDGAAASYELTIQVNY